MSTTTTKQRRSDAATPTDRFVLSWISHHYAIRQDHLRVLLGQYRGVPPGMRMVLHLVDQWTDAGWVERRRFRTDEPVWIWPTQEGLNAIGSHYPYCDFEEDSTLPGREHLAAISDIHLQTDGDWKTHGDWKTQRQLFQDETFEYESNPELDAEIYLPDEKVIAVKAQVSIRDATELAGDLVELLLNSQYALVWYFGVPDARDQIRRVCANLILSRDLSIEEVDRLRIKWYPLARTDGDRQQQELEARLPV